MSVIAREELGRLLATFEHTAYRLELLPAYEESSEADALASFAAGREPSIYPGKRAWIEKVRAATATGRVMQRVHIVTEPLSDYLRYEIGWSYTLNQAAGEDIRILPADPASAAVTRTCDYWLLDSRILIQMEYDDYGRLSQINRVGDPGRVVAANYTRDATLHYAMPLSQYVKRIPQLQRAS